MQARLLRADGADAGPGDPGELLVRGGNIALGYWRNARASAETFLPGGWLRSGDIFRVDEHGNFL